MHHPQRCTAVGALVQKNHPSCGGPERLFASTVPFLHLQAITTASASVQMLISAARVCPWESHTRSSSATTWNPVVMRWWQTQIVTPVVSQIQTFRLQFKGSCIPISYSLKLAYLVSKLWSHPLWGMLCAVLREQTWMSLLLVFEGFFPPCPTVALFDSQSALPTPHHARRWFPYPHAANTLFPPGCGQAYLQAVSFSLWQVFQHKNWGKWHVGTWTSVLFSTTTTSVTGNFAVLRWVPMSVTISACIALHKYSLKCSGNLSAVQA